MVLFSEHDCAVNLHQWTQMVKCGVFASKTKNPETHIWCFHSNKTRLVLGREWIQQKWLSWCRWHHTMARGAEDAGGFNESNDDMISWVSEGGPVLQQLRDIYGSWDETLESTAGMLVLLFYIYRDKSHNKQQTGSLRGGREVIRGGKVSGSPFFLLLTSRCRSAATETSHAVASLLPFILFHLQTSDTREPITGCNLCTSVKRESNV